MKLTELLTDIIYDTALSDVEITDVTCDSRKVKPGSLFVCIAGENFDGHDLAGESLAKGAVAVVCERDLGLKEQILTGNTRKAYGTICCNYFGNPARRLKLIGVTGTNGKTTVTTLIKNILSSCGIKTGLIGTIQNEIGDTVLPTDKTTPDAYDLQKLFLRMADEGCEYVVMEVSSHALDQYRIGNIHYDVAVFTNLTQDHLDYHKTMENYFNAKKRLFEIADVGVINVDDIYGRQLSLIAKCHVVTCSLVNDKADFFATNITCSPSGVSFHFECNNILSKINFAMPGMYSVQNALAAAAVCREVGISLERIAETLNHTKGVKGRSEIIDTGRDFSVICDYAHTPDGLKNILPSIKKFTKGRLITLFGCGGNRDAGKRPIMGEVAAEYSDFLIVTSDNPRLEDPLAIIDDILPGVKKHQTEYVVVPNRKEAIFYAVQHAQPGDVVVLAGKGHEDYQVLGNEKIHFDEREIVQEALATLA